MNATPSQTSASPDNQAENQDIAGSVIALADQFKTFQTFVTRRFDEISMEINATSQQVDMAEEGIGRRFAEIFEIIKAVSFSGDGKTPANAGVELDAVIEVTEKAANTILNAAERISENLHDKVTAEGQNEESRQEAVNAIDADVQEIILACCFQDLTGQRISQTLASLKSIEDRLNSALDKIGIDVETQSVESSPVTLVEGQSQTEIDDIFGEAQSQDAIDDIFADSRKDK